MRTIKVVTTKPELNEAEYALFEESEPGGPQVLIRHGERIDFDPAGLTSEQQQKLADARALLLELATADATAKGLI